MRSWHFLIVGAVLAGLSATPRAGAKAPAPVKVATDVTFKAPGIKDQDDMCLWPHGADPSKSLVIASDKSASRLFVYDLTGRPRQTVVVDKPGNIDLRTGVQLGDRPRDLVVVNSRSASRLLVFAVDPSGHLDQVDDGAIATGAGENYGLALFASRPKGLHAFVTTKEGGLRQIAFHEDSRGRVAGKVVRELPLGSMAEGMVVDDEAGALFVGEEDRGIWQYGAAPNDTGAPVLIARVGDASGLVADVEGLALYRETGGAGYLIASSQGNDSFRVYQRRAPHAFVGSFALTGVLHTDGIEAVSMALGSRFPRGVFLAHNGAGSPCPVQALGWDKIAARLVRASDQ